MSKVNKVQSYRETILFIKRCIIVFNISEMLYKQVQIEYNKVKGRRMIMAQISLRIDDDVKVNAEKVCKDIGMSMSTAVNIYLKRLGSERRIPFEVSADPFYSKENMNELERRVANIRTGKSVLKEHDLIGVE